VQFHPGQLKPNCICFLGAQIQYVTEEMVSRVKGTRAYRKEQIRRTKTVLKAKPDCNDRKLNECLRHLD